MGGVSNIFYGSSRSRLPSRFAYGSSRSQKEMTPFSNLASRRNSRHGLPVTQHTEHEERMESASVFSLPQPVSKDVEARHLPNSRTNGFRWNDGQKRGRWMDQPLQRSRRSVIGSEQMALAEMDGLDPLKLWVHSSGEGLVIKHQNRSQVYYFDPSGGVYDFSSVFHGKNTTLIDPYFYMVRTKNGTLYSYRDYEMPQDVRYHKIYFEEGIQSVVSEESEQVSKGCISFGLMAFSSNNPVGFCLSLSRKEISWNVFGSDRSEDGSFLFQNKDWIGWRFFAKDLNDGQAAGYWLDDIGGKMHLCIKRFFSDRPSEMPVCHQNFLTSSTALVEGSLLPLYFFYDVNQFGYAYVSKSVDGEAGYVITFQHISDKQTQKSSEKYTRIPLSVDWVYSLRLREKEVVVCVGLESYATLLRLDIYTGEQVDLPIKLPTGSKIFYTNAWKGRYVGFIQSHAFANKNMWQSLVGVAVIGDRPLVKYFDEEAVSFYCWNLCDYGFAEGVAFSSDEVMILGLYHKNSSNIEDRKLDFIYIPTSLKKELGKEPGLNIGIIVVGVLVTLVFNGMGLGLFLFCHDRFKNERFPFTDLRRWSVTEEETEEL